MSTSFRLSGPLTLRGSVRLPGDKSLGHRYLLVSALARGRTLLGNPGSGEDLRATLRLVESLGVRVECREGEWLIESPGWRKLKAPRAPIDCGNSGTTARLGCGLLAGLGLPAELLGDASLSRRPMERVITPLRRMGARIQSTDGCLPLRLEGGSLQGMTYRLPVESAQLKSALLLAGLFASGETTILEQGGSRDHTERLLGLQLEAQESGRAWQVQASTLEGLLDRWPRELSLPGDPSSAMFLVSAALMHENSQLELQDLLLNPGRLHTLQLLRQAGAGLEWELRQTVLGEPRGRLRLRGGGDWILPDLRAADLPLLLDEVPALAALALQRGQRWQVEGAGELRIKESDRIAEILRVARAFGVEGQEGPEGFRLSGGPLRPPGEIQAGADHRIAGMLWALSCGLPESPHIHGREVLGVSFPELPQLLRSLGSRK